MKVPGGPKSQKTLTDWPFSLLLSVFSSVDLEVGVRVCLREVSAYGRLEMSSFSREIAGKAIWCPFMGGVRSREVSVSGGSTVFSSVEFSIYTESSVSDDLQNEKSSTSFSSSKKRPRSKKSKSSAKQPPAQTTKEFSTLQ